MKKILIALLLALLTITAVIALSLAIIHSTNFIYKFDMIYLDIPKKTSLSADVIERNVDAVLDYLSPFNNHEFSLPDLPSSSEGASHFEDCKVIFNAIYILGVISAVIVTLVLMFFPRDKRLYRLWALFIAILPVGVGAMIAVDFDFTFILFHKLLFSNDNWLFDPKTDPVIELLPAEFFMHCGIFIAGAILLTGICIFIAGVKKDINNNR